ncbi:MAG TPA: MFS transporter [Usitatibacter sp.]|jgi:MFS family permease|nr:MFS transporter [Usitatibacter sp.]
MTRATDSHAPLSRSFHFFLWTRMLSTASNQILLVALAWQIYDITSSAWDLGLVGLAQFVPTFLLTLPSGQLADRSDRRKLLAAATALQFLAAAILAWGSASGWVGRGIILSLSMLLGMARALQTPAQAAIVPKLVAPVQLPRAMALSSAVMKIAVIAAPALGGFVYAAGAAWAYALCLVIAVAAIFCAMAIEKVPIVHGKEPATLATMFAGFGFMFQQPVVLGAISLDLFAVVLGGATALLPIYAKDILHTGPWGLGLLRSAPAVGALVIGAWLARRPFESGVGKRLFFSVAIYGVSIVVFAFSRDFTLSLVMLAISGAADMVSVVVRQTLVQVETPDEMRGRVSAVNATFISTSNQLGEFRAGTTAALMGPVGAVVFGGVGTLIVVALWMKLFPALFQRDRLVNEPTIA